MEGVRCEVIVGARLYYGPYSCRGAERAIDRHHLGWMKADSRTSLS